MLLRQLALTTSILYLLFVSCGDSPKNENNKVEENIANTDTVPKIEVDTAAMEEEEEEEEEPFKLTEENAIDFFLTTPRTLKTR